MTIEKRITIGESYIRATRSTNLRCGTRADAPLCDADRLLAAAYATARNKRKLLALRVARLRATGDMSGAQELAKELVLHMRHIMLNGGSGRHSPQLRASGGGVKIPSHKSLYSTALVMLGWWRKPTCPVCNGRGHPLRTGSTQVLDTARECKSCNGTGERPIERLVRHEHIEVARSIESELKSLLSVIEHDMKVALRRGLYATLPAATK